MMQALSALGFTTPTPIQMQAVPIVMSGADLVGQASTGTGKTGAFAIPTIENLDLSRRELQILVLCPTRELAVQVADVYKQLLAFKPGAHVVSVYGGQPINVQYTALRRNPMVIVATPGRLMDHMDRGSISLRTLTTVILDEADEMLNMGFRDDIEKILKKTPPERQTLLFSATMPRPILELTRYYLTDPQRITIAPNTKALESIQQSYVEVPHRQKMGALMSLLQVHELDSVLVFCNTKHMVDDLVDTLNESGYMAEGLHGGKVQRQRERILNRFRSGATQVLVATDVAARGIDVSGIQAVINYDLPKTDESYTHRIGRTGRAGNSGRAITLISNHEFRSFRMLERSLKRVIEREFVPEDLPTVVRAAVRPVEQTEYVEKNFGGGQGGGGGRSFGRSSEGRSSERSYGGGRSGGGFGGGGRPSRSGEGGGGGSRWGASSSAGPRARSGASNASTSFNNPSASFGGGEGAAPRSEGFASRGEATAPKKPKGHAPAKKPFSKKPSPKP
jgi:ATP-dependent RNA helicase DeaD